MTIAFDDVTVRFGSTRALDGLSLTLAPGRIYGLLGRNGAGKTTMLSLIASLRQPTLGTVRVNGVDPFENGQIMPEVCFVGSRLPGDGSDRVSALLDVGRRLRPRWDADYAKTLVDRFAIPTRKTIAALSQGQRSAVGIVLGLATRAPVTILDETYLGLDAPSRYAFYDELLRDYTENPRTIIISTHLIEEVGTLFEEVVILDQGRLVLHEEADALRSRGQVVTGPAEAVDAFVQGLTVLSTRQLGPTRATSVVGPVDSRRAAAAGLELTPIGLQDLFVHLTHKETR